MEREGIMKRTGRMSPIGLAFVIESVMAAVGMCIIGNLRMAGLIMIVVSVKAFLVTAVVALLKRRKR